MSGRDNASLRRIADGFSDWRQSSLFWPLAILIGVLLVIQLVRLVLLLITPVSPLGDWQPNQAQVMPLAARSSVLTGFNPFDRSNAVTTSNETASVTSLDLMLYGIRINAAAGGGSAIIAGSDGVQESFAVGEEVLPGVTLASVEFDHVVLDRNGKRESLFIDQSSDVTPVKPSSVKRVSVGGPSEDSNTGTESRTASSANPALAAGIALTPRKEGDKVTGITVAPDGDGSAYKRFGFQPGDVIVEYNGRPVRSTDDVNAMIAKSRPGGRFSVMVERGANILPIAIIVPEQ